MNRVDFQDLAELRLRESRALLTGGFPDGAYYLAGYAVECAIKACIAKRTQEHDFPEKESSRYYDHNFGKLLGYARLSIEWNEAIQVSPAMKASWDIVRNWSEESRYEKKKTLQEAQDLLNAIEDRTGGVLPWIRQRW